MKKSISVMGWVKTRIFPTGFLKKYKLVVTPRARLLHLESEKMRPDQKRIGRN